MPWPRSSETTQLVIKRGDCANKWETCSNVAFAWDEVKHRFLSCPRCYVVRPNFPASWHASTVLFSHSLYLLLLPFLYLVVFSLPVYEDASVDACSCFTASFSFYFGLFAHLFVDCGELSLETLFSPALLSLRYFIIGGCAVISRMIRHPWQAETDWTLSNEGRLFGY